MNLLIVTQKVSVNDPILGFFHRWIIEFSKHFESIIIFCLEEGEHNLPSNVKVYSLGKDRGFGKFSVLKTFISLVWNKRKEYDRVLVHMNPIYLVIAGFVWRFVFRKKVFLWYTHKSVDLKLRIAEKFPSKIFTASKESFRLPSRKVIVTRHGIDTNIFKPDYIKKDGRGLRMLTVGRISRSKSYFVFIRALSMLVNKGLDAELICVGGPVTRDDKVYVKELKNYIKEKGLNRKVKFVGPISNTESVKYFQKADVFVHSSETGSLDKVVLESMACGTPVVTSNDSAVPILSKFNSNCVFIKNDEKDLARKVAYFYGLKDDMHNLQERLREEVVTNHNIVDLINRVSSHIKE